MKKLIMAALILLTSCTSMREAPTTQLAPKVSLRNGMSKQEVIQALGEPKLVYDITLSTGKYEKWEYHYNTFGFNDGTAECAGDPWEAYVLIFKDNVLVTWKKHEGRVKLH